jgi:hypothetical protein
MLFSCTWTCADFALLRKLVLGYLPVLLPCEKCRTHFEKHTHVVNRKVAPDNAAKLFEWLWFMKRQVNNLPTLRQHSISLAELKERHLFHGGALDDVRFGDALVLYAMDAESREEHDTFVSFCSALAVLLPLPEDSELCRHLKKVRRTAMVGDTVRAARAARVEHGLPELSLRHYRQFFES